MGINQYIGKQAGYRKTFREANGPGPWPCHFCGDPVEDRTSPFDGSSFVVHHIDHDSANEAPDNLAPCHHACHSRHHVTERWKDPEYRRLMTEGGRLGAAKTFSDPTMRVRVSRLGGAANGGRRRRCVDCGYQGRPSDVSAHCNRTGHRAAH